MSTIWAILFKLGITIAWVSASAVTANNSYQHGFECPQNWGYFEDPENCIKYYRCDNGKARTMTCRIGNYIGKQQYVKEKEKKY